MKMLKIKINYSYNDYSYRTHAVISVLKTYIVIHRAYQGCNARKVISEVYSSLHCSVLSLGGNVST